jgi:hypothetical protein
MGIASASASAATPTVPGQAIDAAAGDAISLHGSLASQFPATPRSGGFEHSSVPGGEQGHVSVSDQSTVGSWSNYLRSVSCVGSNWCMAVGYYVDPSFAQSTLTESWDGNSWTIVPSPSPGRGLNSLEGVSCTSSSSCTAVGYYDDGPGTTTQTLIQVWNGTNWSVAASLNQGYAPVLFGTSCVSATSCVAVGASSTAAGTQSTLIESWDGSSWNIVPSPSPGSGLNWLFGVSCVSPSSCTAVGSYDDGPGAPEQTLIESWDGTAWRVVAGAALGTGFLNGVSCTSSSNCVAVGSTSFRATLIESWNGTVWKVAAGPNPGSWENSLTSVSCSRPTSCAALGDYASDSPTSRPLAASFDGITWSNASLSVTGTVTGFGAVSCTSPTRCVAVGSQDGSSGERTLVEFWDGTAWSPVPSPNIGTASPRVGMAATPSGDGYWLTDSAGDISPHGQALFYGSMSGRQLNAPITHIVATTDGKGYWLVASDGGTFSFGDARFYGSMGGKPLAAPVVDLTPTPSGHGYWLVASDGGVFAFGDATFAGSMGGKHLNQPVVGIAADSATGGYWLVASDGGIFSFAAPFIGSTGGTTLNQPVVSMASTSDGGGYWFTAADGGVFAYGSAVFHGSMGGQPLNAPVVGMAADDATGGYWLVASDGGVFSFGAPFLGAG